MKIKPFHEAIGNPSQGVEMVFRDNKDLWDRVLPYIIGDSDKENICQLLREYSPNLFKPYSNVDILDGFKKALTDHGYTFKEDNVTGHKADNDYSGEQAPV